MVTKLRGSLHRKRRQSGHFFFCHCRPAVVPRQSITSVVICVSRGHGYSRSFVDIRRNFRWLMNKNLEHENATNRCSAAFVS